MTIRSLTGELARIALLALLAITPLTMHASESDDGVPTEASEQIQESEQGEQSESAEQDDQELTVEERLDALLAETISREDYGETRRCLSRHEYRSVEILNNEYLLFRKSDRYWLNKLKMRCSRLAHNMILTFNPRGSSNTCANDHVWITDRFDLQRGFTPSGMPVASQGSCILGSFEEIAPEQAVLLRDLR
jgi:hypothetical protein